MPPLNPKHALKNYRGSQFTKGVKNLSDNSNINIATSFVVKNKLLNLYSNNQGTYIGEIENQRLNPVYKFGFMFSAAFNQQLDNGQQILTCYFADKKRGILMIDSTRFNLYMIN